MGKSPEYNALTDAKDISAVLHGWRFPAAPIPTGYVGQDWAEGRNVTMNLGGLVSARLTDVWLLKAGVFRSTNDYPVSFADQYIDIQDIELRFAVVHARRCRS